MIGKLLNDDILINMIEDDDNDEIYDYNFIEEETNQVRLNMINNIINHDDSPFIQNNDESDSETDTDDIICDEKNTQSLLNKYEEFIKQSLTDNSSDSDEY